MEEEWKSVVGFEGLYEVSSCGRIKSLARFWVRNERILKTHLDRDGYVCIILTANKVQYNKRVHRLVAEAFIPNPDNLPFINHRNEVKSDNRIENLEWCTVKYNNNYGTFKERLSRTRKQMNLGRPVVQYTTKGEFVKKYPNAQVAAEENGFERTNISSCCRKYRGKKTAYGFVWKYFE